MPNTFFIADSHFGHERIIRYENRPWNSVQEMNEGMIRRWNQRVQESDHVYILGDLCHCDLETALSCIRPLHGQLHLIRGNHDLRTPAYEDCFVEVCDYKEVTVPLKDGAGEVPLVLSHYFMPFYHRHANQTIHLYGHTHKMEDARWEEQVKQLLKDWGVRCVAYNVGALYLDYMPRTLEEIMQ